MSEECKSSQEMNLKQWVDQLPKFHLAHKEYDHLVDEVGRLFTHVGVDDFWRMWNEIGEPHIHGVYESTWSAFRSAMKKRDDDE